MASPLGGGKSHERSVRRSGKKKTPHHMDYVSKGSRSRRNVAPMLHATMSSITNDFKRKNVTMDTAEERGATCTGSALTMKKDGYYLKGDKIYEVVGRDQLSHQTRRLCAGSNSCNSMGEKTPILCRTGVPKSCSLSKIFPRCIQKEKNLPEKDNSPRKKTPMPSRSCWQPMKEDRLSMSWSKNIMLVCQERKKNGQRAQAEKKDRGNIIVKKGGVLRQRLGEGYFRRPIDINNLEKRELTANYTFIYREKPHYQIARQGRQHGREVIPTSREKTPTTTVITPPSKNIT